MVLFTVPRQDENLAPNSVDLPEKNAWARDIKMAICQYERAGLLKDVPAN